MLSDDENVENILNDDENILFQSIKQALENSKGVSMLNDDEKRLKIRAFFFPLSLPVEPTTNWWSWVMGVMIIGAIGAIIIGFTTENYLLCGAMFFGLAPLFGALDWLDKNIFMITEKDEKYAKKKEDWDNLLTKWNLTEELVTQPKKAPINTWLNEDMKAATERALHKLGLTEQELVRDPMIIYGPLFWSTYGIPDDELVTVKLTDGSILFSCYQLVVVCLSAERIATYSANFNFLRNVFLNEKSVEYLYRDIVSVSTEEKSTNYNLPNGKTMRRAQIFRLAVPSGDNIEVVINSPEIRDLLGGEPKLSNHDQSVRVIREMLRTKKG